MVLKAGSAWKNAAQQRLDGAKLDATGIGEVRSSTVLDVEVAEVILLGTGNMLRVKVGERGARATRSLLEEVGDVLSHCQ